MPCFLIDTGCRCRKKLVSITTMRLRRSDGIGCRKMLFQICEFANRFAERHVDEPR